MPSCGPEPSPAGSALRAARWRPGGQSAGWWCGNPAPWGQLCSGGGNILGRFFRFPMWFLRPWSRCLEGGEAWAVRGAVPWRPGGQRVERCTGLDPGAQGGGDRCRDWGPSGPGGRAGDLPGWEPFSERSCCWRRAVQLRSQDVIHLPQMFRLGAKRRLCCPPGLWRVSLAALHPPWAPACRAWAGRCEPGGAGGALLRRRSPGGRGAGGVSRGAGFEGGTPQNPARWNFPVCIHVSLHRLPFPAFVSVGRT